MMKKMNILGWVFVVLFICDCNCDLVKSCPKSYHGIDVTDSRNASVWSLHGYIPSKAFYQNPFYLPYDASCLQLMISPIAHTYLFAFQYYNHLNSIEDRILTTTCLSFHINVPKPDSNLKILHHFGKTLVDCKHSWTTIQEVIGDYENYLFIFGCDSYDDDTHYMGLWIWKSATKYVSDEFMEKLIEIHYKHLMSDIIYVDSLKSCEHPEICDINVFPECPIVERELYQIKRHKQVLHFALIFFGFVCFVLLFLSLIWKFYSIKFRTVN